MDLWSWMESRIIASPDTTPIKGISKFINTLDFDAARKVYHLALYRYMLRYNLREVDERKKIDDVLNVGTANRVMDKYSDRIRMITETFNSNSEKPKVIDLCNKFRESFNQNMEQF
jgi:hypothetical protein